jgi:hypothetical protein
MNGNGAESTKGKEADQQESASADSAASPLCALPPRTTEDQQIAKEMSKAERVMSRWAFVTAIGTLVSAVAICFQWHEMHTGGAVADKQAAAAQHFAEAADKINGGVGDAVAKLNIQAGNTEKLAEHMKTQADRTKDLADQAAIQSKEAIVSANAARDTANTSKETLRKSQRPWVNAESFIPTALTIPPEGRLEVFGDLIMRNTGTSVATDGWAQMIVAPNNGKWLTANWDAACSAVDESMRASHEAATKGLGDGWPIGFVLAPNQETKMRMGGGDADGIAGQQIARALPYGTPTQDARSGQFYLLGCARYKDQFGTSHTTRFCFIYLNDKMSPSGFYVCNGLQTAD